jgi:hypothetical protein
MLLSALTVALLGTLDPVQSEITGPFDWASAPGTLTPDPQGAPARPKSQRWRARQEVLQGVLGVTFYDEFEQSGGSAVEIDGGGDTSSQLPLIGGGAQWKLGGEKIDFGIEALLAFGWRSGATAFVAGGGGAAVAVDVDTFIFDIYGGPFASMFLGEKSRVYVSAGPLISWVDYEQETVLASDSGSGFGTGLYARGGIEFAVGGGTMVGVGARWSDSTIDLDGGLGDLDMSGFQAYLTVTKGF